MILIWKDIKGYEGLYQVNQEGEIRKNLGNNKYKLMKSYPKKSRRIKKYVIKLTDKNGKVKELIIARIVAEAFLGLQANSNYGVVHKNGVQKDNYVNNLEILPIKEIGKKYGATSGRKPVAKIDKYGEIVEFYASGREAGRKNFIAFQAIADRCNGRYKGLLATDGYAYCWDNETDVENMIRRLQEEYGTNRLD